MKKKNIQSILTLYFVALILATVGVVSVIFILIQYKNYKKEDMENLQYSCDTAGENIDLQISQLDAVVLSTINSKDLTDAVYNYSKSPVNSIEHLNQRQRISSLLTSIKGFDYTIRQLSIYSTENIGYGVGDYIGEYEGYDQEEWYLNALNEGGRIFITASDEGNNYFSIYRAYYDNYHRIKGVICGKKYFKDVFRAANDFGPHNTRVIIYDDKGQMIYPNNKGKDEIDFSYLDYYSEDISTVAKGASGNKEMVAFHKMSRSDFTIVESVETKVFTRHIFSSLLPIFLIFICAIAAGVALAFIISKAIATPVQKIYAFLSLKGLFPNARLKMAPTGILEIDQLTESINEYLERSDEQTKKIVSLHEQEIQAQMLALQSQMNPHFLYNSLASIAEMAREGLTEQVKTMTVNISQILRYISSNREQVTTIEEELELCDMYLECMKLRFGDDLVYEFDVDDEMLDYMIPKLCIQLLVENAIKSVTTQSPEWRIKVYGYTEGDNWYIEVQDNGPGWDPQVDKKLRKQMDEILETRTLPSLKIEGMGVLNIFIRFYLLDGISFLFDFGNRSEGGAFVKVGRKLPSRSICDKAENGSI